jgi:hypothetical protein
MVVYLSRVSIEDESKSQTTDSAMLGDASSGGEDEEIK